MVGIARSKACSACRARRKKCDETQPRCGLCVKRDIDCIYSKDLKIVFVQPGTSRSSKSSRSTTPSTVSSLSPVDLPPTCLITSYRNQAQGYFLDTYFPCIPWYASPRSYDDSGHSISVQWLYAAQELALTDPLLNDALSALSLAWMERQSEPDMAPTKGRMMYGKAMRALASKLQCDDEASQDSTLATVLILTAYESQAATKAGMGGWLSHVNGASHLVRLRGPKNMSTSFGRQMFLGSRLSELINAIGSRRQVQEMSPLVPPEHKFEGKYSSYMKFFEIVRTLPGILEQGDAIELAITNHSEAELESKVSILAYTCRDLESRLESWLKQLVQDLEIDNLYWEEPSLLYYGLPVDSPARIFPTYLCFHSLDVGQMVVIYWSCVLLMHCFLFGIEKKLSQRTAISIGLYATDADRASNGSKMRQLAMNITQCLEYFLSPDMGLIAADILGLPINLVLGYWNATNPDAKEILWFQVIDAQVRSISPGFAEVLRAMARKGGGGEAFKQLVLNKAPS